MTEIEYSMFRKKSMIELPCRAEDHEVVSWRVATDPSDRSVSAEERKFLMCVREVEVATGCWEEVGRLMVTSGEAEGRSWAEDLKAPLETARQTEPILLVEDLIASKAGSSTALQTVNINDNY